MISHVKSFPLFSLHPFVFLYSSLVSSAFRKLISYLISTLLNQYYFQIRQLKKTFAHPGAGIETEPVSPYGFYQYLNTSTLYVLFITKVDQFSLLDGKVCMRAKKYLGSPVLKYSYQDSSVFD